MMTRDAIAEVRKLGSAIGSYAVDNNRYPVFGIPPVVDRVIGDVPLWRVDALSGVLKVYIHPMPKRDPWGSHYLFWSDDKHCVVICLGADGTIEHPDQLSKILRALIRGEDVQETSTHCIEDEIVFANDVFAVIPRDPVRRCSSESAGNDRKD